MRFRQITFSVDYSAPANLDINVSKTHCEENQMPPKETNNEIVFYVIT